MDRRFLDDVVKKALDEAPLYKILQGSLNGSRFELEGGGSLDDIKEFQINGLLLTNNPKKGILFVSLDNKEKYFFPFGGEKILNFEIIEVIKAIVSALQKGVGDAQGIATEGALIETTYLGGL